MKRALTLTAAAALVGGTVALAGLQVAPGQAIADETAVEQPARAGQGSERQRGWSRGRHGGGLAMLCSPRRDEWADRFLGRIESRLELTSDQTEAWEELTDVIRASGERADEVCADLREAGRPGTAPERLERAERMAELGLDVLRDLRPAFDAFYATLEPDQREVLDRLGPRRGRRG
jgi:hypothetical protein